MKKHLSNQNNLSVVKVLDNDRQVQKYFALERHPRQKKERLPYDMLTPSMIALLF